MTPETFDALFDRFSFSVFRLEALPAYAGGESDVRAFLGGRPRQERSVRTSAWLARIAASTMAGKRWSRVRVLDEPLTDYQRYELEAYRESQAVGEEVRLVQRSTVGDLGPDFWLFDGETPDAFAVLMRYDIDGRIESRDPVEGAELEGWQLSQIAARCLAASVPLNELLAIQSRGDGG